MIIAQTPSRAHRTVRLSFDRPGGVHNRSIVTLGRVGRCRPRIIVQERFSDQTVLRRVVGGIEIRDLGGAQRPVPKSRSGEAALEKAAEIWARISQCDPRLAEPPPWRG